MQEDAKHFQQMNTLRNWNALQYMINSHFSNIPDCPVYGRRLRDRNVEVGFDVTLVRFKQVCSSRFLIDVIVRSNNPVYYMTALMSGH